MFKLAIFILALVSSAQAVPVHLRTNSLENPLGIATPHPTFSWQSGSATANWMQSAYEIFVATDIKNLVVGKGAVRFGTSSYNMLRGPGAANLDASIFRTFTLPEHLSLQLRLESFNVTNTPHFGTPGSSVSSAVFDSSGNITNPNGFGQITGTSPISRPVDERNFRLGAKLDLLVTRISVASQ